MVDRYRHKSGYLVLSGYSNLCQHERTLKDARAFAREARKVLADVYILRCRDGKKVTG